MIIMPNEAVEEPSEAPKVRSVPRHNYTRLPDDEGLLKLWYENDENLAKTAAAIGCSPAGVGVRIRKLGIEPPHRTRRGPISKVREDAKAVEARLIEVEGRLAEANNQYSTLERRVYLLETALKHIESAQNKAKVSTKRLVDGGNHRKDQLKALKTA